MAKKWKPTQRMLNRYDELVKAQNKLRKQLLKRRQKAEKETSVGRLPDLVIPERAKSSSRINWAVVKNKMFWDKMRAMSAVVTGGIEGWYKRNYKRPIMEAWRDAIESVISEFYGETNIRPERTFGGAEVAYTKEQMEEYPEIAEYMKAFNALQRMPIGEFMYMYDTGYIPAFKYIYNEMKGSFNANYLEELMDSIKRFRRNVPKDYLTRDLLTKQMKQKDETSLEKARRIKHNKLVASQQRAIKNKEEE